MPNILVLGNGFDLYHGLNTRYSDFMKKANSFIQRNSSDLEKKIIESAKSNAIFQYLKNCDSLGDGWIDFEKEIQVIVNSLSKAIRLFEQSAASSLTLTADNPYCLSKKEHSALRFFSKYFIVEYTHKQPTITAKEPYYGYQGIRKQKIIDELRSELDNLIGTLGTYLDHEYQRISSAPKSPQIASVNPDYVINFNYTKTYQHYGIQDSDVFFIHGSLDSSPNNMVLGISDASEQEDNIDFVYFKKYFQRIQKRTGLLDENKFRSGNTPATTYFFGHSLSSHDGEIIRKIQSLSDQMIIFYLNQRDYESKIVNLIDVFGKSKAVAMLETGEIRFEQIFVQK